MLNAATIAAIVAACWAHPSGVAYLEKIERIQVCVAANGNPCCQRGGGYVSGTPIGYLQTPPQQAFTREQAVRVSNEIRDEDDMMLQIIISAITRGMI